MCLLFALFAVPASAQSQRTALYLDRAVDIGAAPRVLPETGFWVSPEELTRINDFVLKPEGACLAELCIPVDREGPEALVREADGASWFDLTGFAEKVRQPWVEDSGTSTTSFGPIPVARATFLQSAIAPDFALPDRNGEIHRLSDHRGKKVLIITWASW